MIIDYDNLPWFMKLADWMSNKEDDRVTPEDVMWLAALIMAKERRDSYEIRDMAQDLITGLPPLTAQDVEDWIEGSCALWGGSDQDHDWEAFTQYIDEWYYK